jgi:hypothetical protein
MTTILPGNFTQFPPEGMGHSIQHLSPGFETFIAVGIATATTTSLLTLPLTLASSNFEVDTNVIIEASAARPAFVRYVGLDIPTGIRLAAGTEVVKLAAAAADDVTSASLAGCASSAAVSGVVAAQSVIRGIPTSAVPAAGFTSNVTLALFSAVSAAGAAGVANIRSASGVVFITATVIYERPMIPFTWQDADRTATQLRAEALRRTGSV